MERDKKNNKTEVSAVFYKERWGEGKKFNTATCCQPW